MRVVLTESAKLDLLQIGDFIAKTIPAAPNPSSGSCAQAAAQLSKLPEAFPLVARYEKHGIRRRVHGHYLIFYRVESQQIIVVRVLHGARDFEAILFPAP